MRTNVGRCPKIEAWLQEHGMNHKQFAEALGVSEKSVWGFFHGRLKNGPRQYTKDDILRVTGMTYEEAFQRAE